MAFSTITQNTKLTWAQIEEIKTAITNARNDDVDKDRVSSNDMGFDSTGKNSVLKASWITSVGKYINTLQGTCTCNCNYCACNCNYCTCNCNYNCTCNCNYCTCNCNYSQCACNCNYSCTCNCNHRCTCNCAYGSDSDERLKDIISETYNYTEDDFKTIKSKVWKYKSDDKETIHFGPIAQDVEKVFPFAIKENDKGYKMLDNISMIGILWETVNKCIDKIDELEQTISELKGK